MRTPDLSLGNIGLYLYWVLLGYIGFYWVILAERLFGHIPEFLPRLRSGKPRMSPANGALFHASKGSLTADTLGLPDGSKLHPLQYKMHTAMCRTQQNL